MGRMPEKWAAAHDMFAKKIHTFARNSFYAIPGYTVEDMEQELLEVLWWCTFDYHPDRGATFNTFFQQSARNRIGTLIRHANAQRRAAEWVSMSDEDVAMALEQIFASDTQSAEDIALMRIDVQQAVRVRGTHALRRARIA